MNGQHSRHPERQYSVLMPLLSEASFIRQDHRILASRFDVIRINVRSVGGLWSALLALRGTDLVFCWFGSLRFLPLVVAARALRIPVVVVAGGYDVAAEPSIGYGNMRGGWRRILGRLLFRLATRVLPYSSAGAAEVTQNAGVSVDRQRTIPLGFTDTGSDASAANKELLVIVVAGVDESTIYRKGLLTCARASALLPDVPFAFVGSGTSDALRQLRDTSSPAAQFHGFVSDATLADLLNRAAVILQPSIHEAFGCSVAEAMLWNCIPIVSDRGSLPEVVGDAGIIIPAGDAQALAAAVTRCLSGEVRPSGMRRRIREHFSIERREEALLAELSSVLAARWSRVDGTSAERPSRDTLETRFQ